MTSFAAHTISMKPIIPHTELSALQKKIKALKLELQEVRERTLDFERLLVSKLGDLIVLEQELALLYKEQKLAKKEKRREQKRRGKNYDPANSVPMATSKPPTAKNQEEEQQKKRLYREAMLHIHPDKFSLQRDQLELATELTTQLIEIYKEGDLASLEAYHAQIFSGNTPLPLTPQPEKITKSEYEFLSLELDQLHKELHLAKNKQTYKVLVEYAKPMDFLIELKAYYADRISKLKRRTRTT